MGPDAVREMISQVLSHQTIPDEIIIGLIVSTTTLSMAAIVWVFSLVSRHTDRLSEVLEKLDSKLDTIVTDSAVKSTLIEFLKNEITEIKNNCRSKKCT